MEAKTGSSTTTYCLKLYCKHLDWLVATKDLYNDVLLFYYQLLINRKELLELSNQKIMRQLEVLTLTSRDNVKPEIPLIYEKVPVYFRRAAINGAIGAVRAYYAKYIAYSLDKSLENPRIAKKFNSQPLFYKGMYKDFEDDSIMLKLWTGSSWSWIKHKVSGRKIPSEAEILSPTIAINNKKVNLHVPIKEVVSDVRTVKERVKDEERICSVSLSISDTLAMCSIFESDGSLIDTLYIRGGNELKHRRKRLFGKITRNRRLQGEVVNENGNNAVLWNKLNHITDYYAHLVSRRIVGFAEKHGAKLIVFANIEQIISFKDKKYLGIKESDFIGRRIVKYTGYKAFKEGKVVTSVRPNYTSCKCHECRTYVKRYRGNNTDSSEVLGGKSYVCENGHKGNVMFNTSMNIGLMFIKRFEFVKDGSTKNLLCEL